MYWQIGQQFEDLNAELERVSHLQDGWDSYHASAPSQGAIDIARRFLRRLRAAMLPPNRVAPSAEGGVGICFVDADKYADFEIFNDREILATVYRGRSEPQVWEVSAAAGSIEDAIRRIREHLNSRTSGTQAGGGKDRASVYGWRRKPVPALSGSPFRERHIKQYRVAISKHLCQSRNL